MDAPMRPTFTLLALVLCLFAAGYVGGKGILFLLLALLLAATGWVFSSLTVEVFPEELI
jgi:4-hydroxybenzoate polyprenyltransferase